MKKIILIVSIFLLSPKFAFALPIFIQSTSTPNNAVNSTSVELAFNQPTTNGDAIVGCIGNQFTSNPPTNIIDTAGDVFAHSFVVTDGNTSADMTVFWAMNIKGQANNIVHLDLQGAYMSRVLIAEYRGLKNTNAGAVDKFVANEQTDSTNLVDAETSGPVTPSSNRELIFGCIWNDNGVGNTITAGTGFTLREKTGNAVNLTNAPMAIEDSVQPVAAPVSATFTFNNGGSNISYMEYLYTFQASPDSFMSIKATMVRIQSAFMRIMGK